MGQKITANNIFSKAKDFVADAVDSIRETVALAFAPQALAFS